MLQCYQDVYICPKGYSISDKVVALVNNYCNKLEIKSNFIQKKAGDIANEICKKEILAGRNPPTVATASILYALK